MNVKTTFLNGEPDGFLMCNKESQLKKAFVWFLYKHPEFGMTELMAFFKVWDSIRALMFLTSTLEWLKINPFFFILYVDNLFFTGEEKLIIWCKREIISE